jgi:DNA polymerase-3 subunit alpha
MFEDFAPYKNICAPGVKLPPCTIEQRHFDALGVKSTISNFEFLRQLCWRGIKEKGIDKLENAKAYYERIKTELETFENLNFVPYILLNWEILNFCHEQKIITGMGRGSCVGSCVLYLLKVTHIDPIKHGLYFERFVSKNRAKTITVDGEIYLDGSLLPDCDHDIEFIDRAKVIEYINTKFAGQTSKILTLNTLSGKACIKECLKIAEGTSEEEAGFVSDSIPKKFGKVLDFVDAEKESEVFKKCTQQYPIAYKIAKKLEGLVKNVGVHPSGLAICHRKIDDIMPLQMTKDGEVISGFEMGDVSALMVKFDILGLRTLSVIDQTAKMVGIDFQSFVLPQEETYAHFQNFLAPQGIFQIETDVGFKVCQSVKPENLDELSDVLSLSRPGSIGFVGEYVKVKEGTEEIAQRWPALDNILKETKGTILFQETIMRVCHEVFGLSLLDAEDVRRACGKKKKEDMEKWQPIIFGKAKEKGIPETVAQFFWDAMIASADYSFNKCIFEEELVETETGYQLIKDIKPGDFVYSWDIRTQERKKTTVKNTYQNKVKIFEVELENDSKIRVSSEHKFVCSDGMKRRFDEIIRDKAAVVVW